MYYLYLGNCQAAFLSRQDFTFITDSGCERQAADASKQSFGSEVYITNWTAASSQAGALLSGESDPPKVNRLGPDCLRMCTVSQTAVSGSPGLINGSCGGSGGGGGVFTRSSHGLCQRLICVSRRCLCLETLWAITDSWPFRTSRTCLGTRLRLGIQPGIFHTPGCRLSHTEDNLCSPPPEIHYEPTCCGHLRVTFPLEELWEVLSIRFWEQPIQSADNNLLSVLRRISLPKSMITLWAPGGRVSSERACQKAVISATVMALYGLLSPGTFQNVPQPFSPPPPLAYECNVTCGNGLLRSSLSLNVF